SRSGANWRIVQADGSHVDFTNLTGEAGSAGLQGTLRRDGKGWIWRWPGGRELMFDARGRLGRIARAGGGQTLIHRSRTPGPLAETIERVTGPDGHELTFRYRVEEGQAYLERVDTRLGPFRYQYDPAPGGGLQLAAVVRPDGMRRRYLHEPALQSGNTHALTGIVVANADGTQSERLNTWGYDL